MASKVYIIIRDIELGKAYALPVFGQEACEGDDGAEVRGIGKKRKATCNQLHRGSKFAFIRKDADLPVVFHCMNGGKPIEM